MSPSEPTPPIAREPSAASIPAEPTDSGIRASLQADGLHDVRDPRAEDDAEERISGFLHASLGFEVG